MGPHAHYRVPEAGAVLDLDPLGSVRIVAGPALRSVVKHSRVEPGASAGAGLEQDLGEVLNQSLI